MGVPGLSWPRGDLDLEGLTPGNGGVPSPCGTLQGFMCMHAQTLNSHLPRPSAAPQQHQSTDCAPKALILPPDSSTEQDRKAEGPGI